MAVLDTDLIQLISYIEKKTGAETKEVFYDQNEKLTVIVPKGQLGKVLGKKAQTLRKLEQSLGKKLRVAEYSDDKTILIKNLVAPLRLQNIEEKPDGSVVLYGGDQKTNGLLIGKQARNLRNLEWMTRKFHEVPEIRVE